MTGDSDFQSIQEQQHHSQQAWRHIRALIADQELALSECQLLLHAEKDRLAALKAELKKTEQGRLCAVMISAGLWVVYQGGFHRHLVIVDTRVAPYAGKETARKAIKQQQTEKQIVQHEVAQLGASLVSAAEKAAALSVKLQALQEEAERSRSLATLEK